jgi:dipeptidyl aminopeptidase/acylaminoacyl peptidase
MRHGRSYWLHLLAFPLAMLALIPFLALTSLSYIYTGFFTRVPCVPASRTPADIGIARFEDVAFQTPDGVTAHGWYVPSSNHAVIILVPGLGGARDGMLDDAAILARHGYGLLMYDSRQCNVPGARNSLGYVETNELLGAVEYLSRRDAKARIGALGFSEGGTIVIRGAARDGRIGAVVAEGGFHNLAQHVFHGNQSPLVRRLAEWQVLMFFRLDTGVDPAQISPVTDISRNSPRPVLLIYGEHEAERGGAELLFRAAGDPKELWIVPGAGHGGYIGAAPREYERRVIAFFDKALKVGGQK